MRKDDIIDSQGRPQRYNIELLTDHAFSKAFDRTQRLDDLLSKKFEEAKK